MSAEGAALRRYKHCDLANDQFVWCRAFGTHLFFHPNPGLTAGPSHCRSFGPDCGFCNSLAGRPYGYRAGSDARVLVNFSLLIFHFPCSFLYSHSFLPWTHWIDGLENNM